MMSENEIVGNIVDSYCTACLADLKPSDETVECANCEGQLHVTCNDCPCQRVRQEQRRVQIEDFAIVNANQWVIESQVDHLTRYCVDCLADFTNEELYRATKCKACTARLHAGCRRCICEHIKESDSRP